MTQDESSEMGSNKTGTLKSTDIARKYVDQAINFPFHSYSLLPRPPRSRSFRSSWTVSIKRYERVLCRRVSEKLSFRACQKICGSKCTGTRFTFTPLTLSARSLTCSGLHRKIATGICNGQLMPVGLRKRKEKQFRSRASR